ncbi:MAG TPA: hypothetical protein PKZ76_00960 [Xanthomonadaceae bacterium]|nr:hypothetical protein [Xanthomonadaceae bacterium]
MSRTVEALQRAEAMRMLYSATDHEPRPAHRVLADADAGARRLAEIVRTWSPRPRDLADAMTLCDGLARVLRELATIIGRAPDG